MENKSHAFWAGAFSIGLALAVALAVFWFNRDHATRVPYDLIARTNVTGLTAGSAVRYRGLDVGKVKSLRFDPQHPGQIVIRILVDKTAPITHSTFGVLALQGVTGLGFVQLDDTGRDLTPLPSSVAHVAQLDMHAGLLDELQQRGGALLDELQSVAARANAVLSPETRTQLVATAASLQRAADSVTSLAHDADPAVKALPGTVDELHRTLASADALMTTLNASNGPLYANLDKLGGAAERAGATVAHMDASLEAISSAVEYDMLPRVATLTGDLDRAARSIDRAAGVFATSPRSVLFGVQPAPPGPGEPGFVWPRGSGAAR